MNYWRLMTGGNGEDWTELPNPNPWHPKNIYDAMMDNSKPKVIALGWGKIGDLSMLHPCTSDSIRDKIAHDYPEYKTPGIGGRCLFGFCKEMEPGDLVIISACGERRHVVKVIGQYHYQPYSTEHPLHKTIEFDHTREVIFTSEDPNKLWGRLTCAPTWSVRFALEKLTPK